MPYHKLLFKIKAFRISDSSPMFDIFSTFIYDIFSGVAIQEFIHSTRALDLIRILASLKSSEESLLKEDPIFQATGYHAMEVAVISGHNENLSDILYKNLFKSNDIIDRMMPDGQTKLTYAASKGYTLIIDTLVKHGAQMRSTNLSGQNALHAAVESGNEDAVSTILKSTKFYGTELLEKVDNYNMNPAMISARNGRNDLLDLFIREERRCITWKNKYNRYVLNTYKLTTIITIIKIQHKIQPSNNKIHRQYTDIILMGLSLLIKVMCVSSCYPQ